MRNAGSSFWRIALVLIFLLLIPPVLIQPAAAQGPTPAAAPAEKTEEPQEKVVEEITVTALLREEKLQDVPFSVAAPTEEELRERGVDSIEGIRAGQHPLMKEDLPLCTASCRFAGERTTQTQSSRRFP